MKTFYQLFLLFALFWGLARPTAQATHILGADLTWSCNPQNPCLYTFTFTYYQDCPTNIPPDGPNLLFYCFNTSVSVPSTSNGWIPRNMNGIDITPLCTGQQSTCNGGTIPGVEQFVLTRTYNFCSAPPCAQFRVDWGMCCRSNLITSLNNPQTNQIFASSTVPFNANSCNSSPTFNSDPIIYVCEGQSTNFSMGATDPDGNTLQYSLVACRRSASTPVSYATGFNATNPLGPGWNVGIDQNTGEITLANTGPSIPNLVGVMCVQVDELDNGQVIGSMVRDMQIRVVNCNNNLPTLTGFDGNTDFTSKACVGSSTCFDILSNDADANDVLTVSLVSGPPGLTLTTAGSPHPTATICWSPTLNDIGTHTFTLEVRDNACPLNGIQQYTYTLEVVSCSPCDLINPSVNWTHTQSLLDVTVTNTTTGGPVDFTEFKWGDGSTSPLYPGNYTLPVNHTYAAAGTYEVCVKTYTYVGNVVCRDSLCKEITVTDNPCDEHTADWYSLAVFQDPCTYYFFDASTPGSSSVLWDFGTGDPLQSGSGIPFTFPGSGTYTITMYSTYHPPSKPELCCYDTHTATLTVLCNKPSSEIKRLAGELGSQIFWNQQNSTLRVTLEANTSQTNTSVGIYDLSGKLLHEQSHLAGSETSFDLSGLASGIYLVRTISGDQVETKKFAKY